MIKHLEALVHGRGRMMTACGIAMGIMALGILPAAAQDPTLRLTPDPLILPLTGNGTVTVTAENAGGNGVQGFHILLLFNNSQISFVSAAVDPTLAAAWGGAGNFSSSASSVPGGLEWVAAASSPLSGPTGTVVLGTLTFSGEGTPGTGTFTWDFNTRLRTANPFGDDPTVPIFISSDYQVGAAASDLTIACTQSSPADPNVFVDGDTITLNCAITNSASQATGSMTSAIAVISSDMTVDSGDRIIDSTSINSLGAGNVQNVVFSGSPSFGNGGSFFICAKADVIIGNLNQQGGLILETNETNNVDCHAVQIPTPTRDLVATGFTVTPDASDPNAIHAGSFVNVAYTLANNGNAKVRDHQDVVRISSDNVIDASDTTLCSITEPDPPGLFGGQSVPRSYGTDPNAPPSLRCGIDLSTTPGTYFIGIQLDASSDVTETNEANNTAFQQVTVAGPVPSRIAPHGVGSPTNTNAVITGPGKGLVRVSISRVSDIASYAFTLSWSNPSFMAIVDPNDVVFEDPDTHAKIVEQNGRVQTCGPPTIDNVAGTVAISCTSSGAAAGGGTSGSAVLAAFNFQAQIAGTGTLHLSNISAATSDGTPIVTAPADANYTVTGSEILSIDNATPPPSVYPGTVFSATYRICNDGFGPSTNNVPMTLYVSPDDIVDVTASPADQLVCRFIENNPIQPNDCHSLTAQNCKVIVDLPPGNYFAAFQLTPTNQDLVTLALPSRLLTVRKSGSGASIETTALPDQIGGSAGSVLSNDRKFPARSVSVLRSGRQNLNFLASHEKPGDNPPQIALYRIPKKHDDRVERLNTLRVSKAVRALAGAADIDGDGNDEVALIVSGQGGDYLDFRSVDYIRRKPIIGLSAAITPPFPDRVVAAAGVQFDGDPEEEIAVVTEDSAGAQSLRIYDLTVQTPPPPPAAPIESALTEVASDTTTFGSASAIEGMCSTDADLDPNTTTQILVVTRESGGTQAVKVYDLPTGVGADDSALVADDLAFGMTTAKKRVIAFTCTR
jgi:hypothetical protein